MNLPNLISLARLLTVPVVVWAILDDRFGLAFWLFVGAGISDAVDGFIARHFHARSQLGAYLDPLADKALLVSIYVALGTEGYLPNWLVIVVVFRDIMIVGGVLLYHTLDRDVKFGPLFISKVNTVAQIVLAGFVLATFALEVENAFLIAALTWLVALTTLLSGASYVARVWRRNNRVETPS